MKTAPLLSLRNVSLSYFAVKRDLRSIVVDYCRGRQVIQKIPVLENISFDVHPGEMICLAGSNGSGKSTLLYAICGKMALQSGTIERRGELLAFLGGIPGCDPYKPGIDLLIYLAYLYGKQAKDVYAKLDFISRLSGLPREVILDQPLFTYSQGMVSRLASAFPLCFHTDITLFDETWGKGDSNFLNTAFTIAERNLQRGCCYIIVSHADNIWRGIRERGGRFIVLGNNSLLYDGKSEEEAREIYNASTKYRSAADI